VVVRAERLAPETITAALARGDFYSSTGITLDDVAAGEKVYALKIKPVGRLGAPSNARYTTRFIGRGGKLLAEVHGTEPRYTVRGDEGYVRAAITDSNGRRAWTQPVFLGVKP
jgi:hypothetical protein